MRKCMVKHKKSCIILQCFNLQHFERGQLACIAEHDQGISQCFVAITGQIVNCKMRTDTALGLFDETYLSLLTKYAFVKEQQPGGSKLIAKFSQGYQCLDLCTYCLLEIDLIIRVTCVIEAIVSSSSLVTDESLRLFFLSSCFLWSPVIFLQTLKSVQ